MLQIYTLGTVSTLLACRAVMCMGSKHCGLQDTEDDLVLCVWMVSMARTRLWGPLVGQLPPACWSAWQLISQEHNRNICWQGCGTPGASTQLWEIALPAHGSCGVQIYYVCAGKLGLVGYGAGSAACGFLAHLMASDSLPYSPDVQIPIVTLWFMFWCPAWSSKAACMLLLRSGLCCLFFRQRASVNVRPCCHQDTRMPLLFRDIILLLFRVVGLCRLVHRQRSDTSAIHLLMYLLRAGPYTAAFRTACQRCSSSKLARVLMCWCREGCKLVCKLPCTVSSHGRCFTSLTRIWIWREWCVKLVHGAASCSTCFVVLHGSAVPPPVQTL